MAEHKEKKRKRGEDANSRPKKKVAIQDSQPTQSSIVKVSSIQQAKTCPPVIATSPGLCLPDSVKFQAYTKPQPSSAKRSKRAEPLNLMLHSSSHSKLDYTAKEEGPGGRESHLKHYIAVFDPSNGKLAVIEAKKMAVRGVVRTQKPPEEDTSERQASKTMMELRNNLGEAFGTKKAKKALAAITENAIAPERAVAEAGRNPQKLSNSSQALMESINDVTSGMASKEDLQAAADAAKPVPPGNFEAQEIQDVYTLEELIGGEILNSIPIQDWRDQLKKGTSVPMPTQFIARRLVPINEGPNPVHRLRALRYLDFLIKFTKSSRPGKERGTRRIPPRDKLREILKPAPEPVVENIRRKFSSNGEMRKFHTDLTYTYCCALAAVLANFSFDTASIRYDLGLDEKQFAQYFREIGGKVKNAKGAEKGTHVQVAVLALPLEFPKVRYQRPRGR
ncbi:RNA polymerase I associated factor, A49-like protein [Hypoxylon trugodes]|uniref:RNA polymerase I associated factor, A49-like protein n=1 Tax=Hypoxylon trugodes TaxID=326681 RepID=UPI0021A19430|nr:RNA polymerase I associated factor, A49-like protein [Hypoxylon trugodes]KAI1393566.1 RNA polymerase I associated factor, A49-like protein [Hypoxylon trugodes]